MCCIWRSECEPNPSAVLRYFNRNHLIRDLWGYPDCHTIDLREGTVPFIHHDTVGGVSPASSENLGDGCQVPRSPRAGAMNWIWTETATRFVCPAFAAIANA